MRLIDENEKPSHVEVFERIVEKCSPVVQAKLQQPGVLYLIDNLEELESLVKQMAISGSRKDFDSFYKKLKQNTKPNDVKSFLGFLQAVREGTAAMESGPSTLSDSLLEITLNFMLEECAEPVTGS